MHAGPTLEDVSVPYEYSDASACAPKADPGGIVTSSRSRARIADAGAKAARDPMLWQRRGMVRKKTIAPKADSLVGVRLQVRVRLRSQARVPCNGLTVSCPTMILE